MKRFLAPILLLTLLFPTFAIGETMDDLVERDGIHYKKFSDTPFTGKVTAQTQGSLKNGKRDGPWVYYRENGELEYKGTYKNGKRDGPSVVYYKNGQLVSKGNYKDGKKHGPWVGYNEDNLEVYTWATAMACNTENIMVFATSHVPTVHPMLAAKQCSSIDNISSGRFGLNIVCGWFRPEIQMLGIELLEHDDRYRMADEWLTVIKRTWTEQDFDHEGEFYNIKGGFLLPKPIQEPYPTLINAGSSEAGREFSAKHVDFNFLSITTHDDAKEIMKDVTKRAHGYGRECGFMTMALVCCRDTEEV